MDRKAHRAGPRTARREHRPAHPTAHQAHGSRAHGQRRPGHGLPGQPGREPPPPGPCCSPGVASSSPDGHTAGSRERSALRLPCGGPRWGTMSPHTQARGQGPAVLTWGPGAGGIGWGGRRGRPSVRGVSALPGACPPACGAGWGRGLEGRTWGPDGPAALGEAPSAAGLQGEGPAGHGAEVWACSGGGASWASPDLECGQAAAPRPGDTSAPPARVQGGPGLAPSPREVLRALPWSSPPACCLPGPAMDRRGQLANPTPALGRLPRLPESHCCWSFDMTGGPCSPMWGQGGPPPPPPRTSHLTGVGRVGQSACALAPRSQSPAHAGRGGSLPVPESSGAPARGERQAVPRLPIPGQGRRDRARPPH